MAEEHVYLIDGSAYIWRAYHALGQVVRMSDNMPISAVKGFAEMLWRLMRGRVSGGNPTHIAVVFDHRKSRENRQAVFAGYKAKRKDPPDDIRHQFSLVRAVVRAFGLACIEHTGHEADDIIATYAQQAVERGGTAVIVSGDKDFYQLICEDIMVFDPFWLPPEVTEARRRNLPIPRHEPGRVVGEMEVRKRFGVPPCLVCDVQALMGDPVDNVPGVEGIGQVIAAELVTEHGSLQKVLENAPFVKQAKRRERLIAGATDALMSLELVTLKRDVMVYTPFEELEYFPMTTAEAEGFLAFAKGLALHSLGQRVAESFGLSYESVKQDEYYAQEGAGTAWRFRKA